MNFGREIIRDWLGEQNHLRGLKVLNIGKSNNANLNVCYGEKDSVYTQFFIVNCDEYMHIIDPAFYQQEVFYRNRLYFFDFGLKEVMERLHMEELCSLPEEVIQEELKRLEKIRGTK